MSAAAGPVFAASLLLAFAGVTKLHRPSGTAAALRSAGIDAPRWLGRAVGGLEVAVATWCLAAGTGAASAVVAATYLGFAAFNLRLMTVAGSASCGCFGEADAPASSTHVGVNLVLSLVAGAAAIDPPGSLTSVLADQPLGGAPLLMLIVLGAWASYLALTLLPELGRASAPAREPSR
jgi:hypothetical protein